jgi:putative transposase
MPVSRSPHAIHQLYLHLVFVTLKRAKILDVKREADYRVLFADICERIGRKSRPKDKTSACKLIEFGMEADHVHLLVHYPTTITVAQLAGYLKGISSHEWPDKKRSAFGDNRLWSSSYFAKTVGHTSSEQTGQYLRKQGKSADREALARSASSGSEAGASAHGG